MKNAGKGMGPKKGYNAKNWNIGYDQIDWADKSEITIMLPNNTIGYFPIEEKDKQNGKQSNNSGNRIQESGN